MPIKHKKFPKIYSKQYNKIVINKTPAYLNLCIHGESNEEHPDRH